MPSLNASSERSGERCSTTSSSSVRITYGASSLSTCASTMKRVRTTLSGTSSRFHGLLRQRDAYTQSPYSAGSITTTGVSLDENCARCSWRTGFVARTVIPELEGKRVELQVRTERQNRDFQSPGQVRVHQ